MQTLTVRTENRRQETVRSAKYDFNDSASLLKILQSVQGDLGLRLTRVQMDRLRDYLQSVEGLGTEGRATRWNRLKQFLMPWRYPRMGEAARDGEKGKGFEVILRNASTGEEFLIEFEDPRSGKVVMPDFSEFIIDQFIPNLEIVIRESLYNSSMHLDRAPYFPQKDETFSLSQIGGLYRLTRLEHFGLSSDRLFWPEFSSRHLRYFVEYSGSPELSVLHLISLHAMAKSLERASELQSKPMAVFAPDGKPVLSQATNVLRHHSPFELLLDEPIISVLEWDRLPSILARHSYADEFPSDSADSKPFGEGSSAPARFVFLSDGSGQLLVQNAPAGILGPINQKTPSPGKREFHSAKSAVPLNPNPAVSTKLAHDALAYSKIENKQQTSQNVSCSLSAFQSLSRKNPPSLEHAPISAVLFDLDGVLANSEELHRQTFNQVFAPFGVSVPRAYWYSHYIGTGSRHIVHELVEKNHLEADENKLLEQRKAIFQQAISQGKLSPVPGALKLVSLVQANSLKAAVASGGHRDNIKAQLVSMGLSLPFLGLEDAKNRKPDPEVFLKSAARLGVSPSACLVIEDSAAGLLAAKSAGMRCILIGAHHPPQIRAQADLWVSKLSSAKVNAFVKKLAGIGKTAGIGKKKN